MATTLSTTANNSHITALQKVFYEARTPIEWLVIAHNDARMLQSLSSALTDESAAILEISQDTWDFGDKEFAETIEWALRQGEIKNLLLVGNSQSGGGQSRASSVTSSASGYGDLFAGAKRHHARAQEAQQRFASHMNQLFQLSVVDTCCSSDTLSVYGLFYRAESGLFLAYDAEADAFRPLVAN